MSYYSKKPKVSLRVVKQVVIESKSYMYPKSAANAWAQGAGFRAWKRWNDSKEIRREYAAVGFPDSMVFTPGSKEYNERHDAALPRWNEYCRKSCEKHNKLIAKAIRRSLPIFTKMLKG